MGRKSLPTSLISMKTKSVVIQRTRGFGNRVILSITECVYISNGGSRDPGQRKNSTESRESIQILSRSEGQEAKSSTSDSIQEKLIFLFKATSKDRGHRVKIWSAYVRVTLKLHKRKANTFQRKIDRLVDQDGSQTDPRAPKRKPEVGPRAPELEDEGKASQGIRLEEGGGKNSWNKAQPPSSGLLHSQLYTFIIRPHFSNTVVAQGKLTTFLETSMSRLLGKNQVALSKLTGVLAAFKAIISPKSSSFRLESQQANSIRNLGEMRRLILDLWKREQTFPSVLPGDLKLRSTKPVEHEDPKVRVTSQSQKLLHDREHLPSDLLYFPGFAPSSELSKRQKRDADGFGELTQVPLGSIWNILISFYTNEE
ncbi:uncharacterized protein C1orf185 homolog isoform X2 [Dromiciops gliroides]|uniref:uncharacterized protein C1orf185 homolog isoform X2 n=1 Tax=Dromiciops gliroides TaxID=33562 RepID=UPI001CC7D5B4|nr:uncharacterized protein C1orf185 homolog isoform X2 [Dromiciops gliroides]